MEIQIHPWETALFGGTSLGISRFDSSRHIQCLLVVDEFSVTHQVAAAMWPLATCTVAVCFNTVLTEPCWSVMCTEFVCPTLGYKEFLHSDWLIQILSWQKPVGCWGSVSNSSQSAKSKRDRRRHSEKKSHIAVNITDAFQQGSDVGLQPPVFKTRQLLYEKIVSGNHLQCW